MSRGMRLYLQFTALVSGALVMVIEVLGSRVISPFFGVSLYVWTSLITVTLLALALGYAAGGWLADRGRSADQLYGLLMLTGLVTLLVPVLRAPVLEASAPLGLRAGALAATALLFGPSLFMLGCVAPYLVRLCARDPERLGRTVGGLYALSTAGSVLGTMATGFALVVWLGADDIFRLAAAVLLALGGGYFAVVRRRLLAPVAVLAPLLVATPSPPADLRMPDGTRVEEVASAESLYGHVKVVDYSHGGTGTREMIIDGLVQGGVDRATGLSVYGYAYLLQFLPVALLPEGRSCLVIGVGAGIVPRWYAARGIETDAVDIDPAVVRLAGEHFGYVPSGALHLADARTFLAARGRRYDYLFVDVFNGDITPVHLLSVEALRQIKARLTESGILAFNLVVEGGERTRAFAAVMRTLGEVFEQVEVVPLFDAADEGSYGNAVVLAYDGERREPDFRALGDPPVHALAADAVRAAIGRRVVPPPLADAPLLSDDFNPVDVLDAPLRERLRQHILDTTHWRLLLGAGRVAAPGAGPA